ncbi:MAG: Flp pilus assembly complex ATPase component TadA [Phycisphaerae bacterium]|nr:Flp pilus assembly complex ATPase component TadA [Phycisphaerae bacterium]
MPQSVHNNVGESVTAEAGKTPHARQDETVGFTELWRPEHDSEFPRGPVTILLENKQITPEQAQTALDQQKENPQLTVLEALIDTKAIDETTAMKATAAYFNIPFLSIKPEDIDNDMFRLLDPEFIKRRCVLPIRREDDKILVGISNPADIFLVDEVKQRIRGTVKLVVVSPEDIIHTVEELDESTLQGVDEIIQGISEDDLEVVDTKIDEVTDLEKIASESPVIRYVNFLITKAVQDGVSDIHVEPGERSLRVRYRIDGVLFAQAVPPLAMHAAIIARGQIMSNVDIAEQRLPQDGRIKALSHNQRVDLRVSMLPTTNGEKCVIRILDSKSILIGLEHLGMWDDTLEGFHHQITQPHGIVLVTGPTGSGKTTTLYSALRVIDGDTLNISTVEDPVEYQLGFTNQVNVREHIGMTFAAALRSLLRQDPDIIMLGEIRDEETARIAVQASLTGHLVLSTLHTNDASSSITRMINIGIEPYLISASVNAILAQRLIRRICENCKTPETKKDGSVARYLTKHKADISQVYHGAGCDKCRNTGYKGRLGIYEMLEVDDEMRDLITSNPSLMELRRACSAHGMRTLVEDGLQKVAAGLTTVEEIARVTET